MGKSVFFWVLVLSLVMGLDSVGRVSAEEDVCPGSVNEAEVLEVEPKLVVEDPFGKRYQIERLEDSLPLVHVYGSPFELGRAHGTLLKVEIQEMYSKFFTYLEDKMIGSLHLSFLPDVIARAIARVAVNAALDTTYLLTWMYIPSRFIDEMTGLASGAEVYYWDVVRIQMIPEYMQASCSMLGSWGPATLAASRQGSLHQMRALDWDMEAPILKSHAVVVYHPVDGNAFALFTWAGFIGCVTCYSGNLGISEKVWLGYDGSSNKAGMPWHFVLRDVLQFTKTISEAQQYLEHTSRTCPILVGIGSAVDNRFYLVGYSPDPLVYYDDSNFTMLTSPVPGDDVPGVVFVDKYVQPSQDGCMDSLVTRYYGALDGKAMIEMISLQQTGEMHTALYDFTDNKVLFSWATVDEEGQITPAYNRPFFQLDMSSLDEPESSCCNRRRQSGCPDVIARNPILCKGASEQKM